MKTAITTIMLESVQAAVKFYTEKLGLDIVELARDQQNPSLLFYAHLKKGKFHIMVRGAHPEEAVELSQIKHCIGRGTGIYVQMKKGLDKLYARCQKKGVTIASEIKEQFWGERTFEIKDPFGIKIMFGEPIEGATQGPTRDFYGHEVDTSKSDDAIINDLAAHLKHFGITRRPAKKHAKQWLKELRKK